MEDLRDPNTLCRGGAGHVLDLPSPPIAQGALRIFALSFGFSVPDQIKIHKRGTCKMSLII
jgi:hypothetical protein